MTTVPTISGHPLAVGVPVAAVEHPGGSSGGQAAGAPSPESTGAPAATSISARASSP